jgi:MFS family permease
MKKNNYTVFTLLFIATILCGAISTLMSAYLTDAVKQLLGIAKEDEVNRISATINSIFIIGSCLGGILGGIISDKIGRKNATAFSIIILGLGTLLTAIAPNWYMVVICRFFSGIGVGAILVLSFTYLNEIWDTKTFAIYSGFLSIAFPIGIFSAGTINFFISNWRQAFYVGCIPLLLGIIGYFILDESAVWLQEKNIKTTESTEKFFTAANKKNVVNGAIIFGTMLIGLWAIFLWLPTWVQSISTAENSNQHTGMSMMLLGGGGLLGGFFSGWLMNYLGTKKSMLLCFAMATIGSFILFYSNKHVTAILFIEIGVLALFFGASQGILSAYIPQLFPTTIKATATGFCFNAGRLLTAIAVFFVGLLVSIFGGYANTLLVFSMVFVVGLIFVFFTKQNNNGTY